VPDIFDVRDRAVLVTGASQGIGRGIATLFGERGARVAVHHRSNAEGAREVAESIRRAGGTAHVVSGELRDPAVRRSVIEEVVRTFGRVDVLVNNAAAQPLGAFLEISPQDLDLVIDSTLKSVFAMTQAAAKAMIAKGEGGSIINITSIESLDPAPMHSHYDAAKAGVAMLTKAAALELGKHAIRVNAVAPGLIDRPGLRADWPDGVTRYEKTAPLGRLGSPEDVAGCCVFLASFAARFVTGATIVVDGGVTATQSF
jgi:NAD(P)-dependent dehydrogenase (short-subunit alcohol dehydrogenase family)